MTGEGFPERRRVRLMITEDLVHYLDKSGQTLPRRTLVSKRAPERTARGPVDADLPENLPDDDAAKQLSMSKVREGLSLISPSRIILCCAETYSITVFNPPSAYPVVLSI